MCKRLSIPIFLIFMLVLSTNVQAQPTGTILIEYWNNMGGTNLENNFYNQARFPDDPDDYEILTLFDKPYSPEYGNNYGAQIRGYLYPPETGDYTFWIAADDDADLFLSTDDNPTNKVKIAEINGWCPAYDFDNTGGTDNPNQVSAPVTLQAGVKYYIEGAYKEGGGGDGMATAWQGPGIPDRVIIDGAYLSPAAFTLVLLKAGSPVPADGAVDADVTALEWTAGPTAVSQKVYLSTDATIDDADLLTETGADLSIAVATLDPGASYWWRVDEIEADGNVIEGNVWSFTTLPLEAHFPSPGDGDRNIVSEVLSWTPGKNAIMHNVHFGTDPAMLLPVQMMSMDTSYDPGALALDTTYYWRVDEFTPVGTVTGPVWSFSTLSATEPPITDPNLVAYWTCDDGEGSHAVLDSSGHGNHGIIDGPVKWPAGQVDGAIEFLGDDQGFVELPASMITAAKGSIFMWINTTQGNSANNDEGMLFYAGNGNGDGYGGQNELHINIDDPGNGQLDFFIEDDPSGGDKSVSYNNIGSTGWRHVGATWDLDDGIKLYVDGFQVDENSHNGATYGFETIRLGRPVGTGNGNRFYQGLMDDVMLYDYALGEEQIRQTFADTSLPYKPSPADGAGNQVSATVLSWSPGDGALLQDVYLGTDAAAVAAADATDTTGIYQSRQPETTFDPDLAGGKTYYWRVDQVAADLSIVAGPVWSFSTATMVPAAANLGAPTSDVPGFLIRSLKAQSQINNFNEMNEILDTGLLDGEPPVAGSEGTRIDEVVNLRDTGNGAFGEDKSFPGIDALDVPAADPADGDDDNDFATEIRGSVQLTAGVHRIGANSDDGTIVWVGGIEIGRSEELKGASNRDFTFEVAEDGYYNIRARTFERGGGSSIELHEILADGTRLLLNDVAGGGSAVFAPAEGVAAPELIGAFAFGSRDLVSPTANDPSVNYTMVLHGDREPATVDALKYDAAKGYGYEVIDPDNTGRRGFAIFGPFDDSPNNRNEFSDELPEQLYDSFIGAKNFSSEVSANTMGDMDTPSPNPEGIIFRVDVPNGTYRFVAVFGEADNNHAARIVAEDGGSGPPADIGANSVVLVHNHDQAQFDIGQVVNDDPGNGVFARVGFDDKLPPTGDGVAPDPQFVDMGYDGRPNGAANSPALEVNQGYIRIHQLQGNSNDGPGGGRDPNGGDIVILELWRVR